MFGKFPNDLFESFRFLFIQDAIKVTKGFGKTLIDGMIGIPSTFGGLDKNDPPIILTVYPLNQLLPFKPIN